MLYGFGYLIAVIARHESSRWWTYRGREPSQELMAGLALGQVMRLVWAFCASAPPSQEAPAYPPALPCVHGILIWPP
jgi:hypothetical protein